MLGHAVLRLFQAGAGVAVPIRRTRTVARLPGHGYVIEFDDTHPETVSMALTNAQKQKRWRDKRNTLARLADDHFDLTRRVLKGWSKKRASKSPHSAKSPL
jgi:hypothetical protein